MMYTPLAGYTALIGLPDYVEQLRLSIRHVADGDGRVFMLDDIRTGKEGVALIDQQSPWTYPSSDASSGMPVCTKTSADRDPGAFPSMQYGVYA